MLVILATPWIIYKVLSLGRGSSLGNVSIPFGRARRIMMLCKSCLAERAKERLGSIHYLLFFEGNICRPLS